MLQETAEYVKKNAGATISVATIVSVIGGYTLLLQHLDARYCLAGDAQQTQAMITDYIKKELEDKIFMVEMLEQRDKATDVDIAMKQRYLRQLEEMKSK